MKYSKICMVVACVRWHFHRKQVETITSRDVVHANKRLISIVLLEWRFSIMSEIRCEVKLVRFSFVV